MVKLFDDIRASRVFQTLMRVLQFLSSVISLGLFSARLYKIRRLIERTNKATGAVEGILAAATLYTLAVTLISCCLRRKAAPKILRWLLIALDLAFMGAFIAVATLTRPNGGPGGAITPFCAKPIDALHSSPYQCESRMGKLPLGTFILAIVSTILHLITAVFHEIHDKYHANNGLSNDDRYQGTDTHELGAHGTHL